MSWIGRLYETYENCAAFVGKLPSMDQGDKKAPMPLLPVAHTTQEAAIEVTVNSHGEFVDAKAIENKADRMTVIQCTEESAGRAGSKIAPHPLHEKLEYVAGDFDEYFDSKGGCRSRYEAYLANLEKWCASEFSERRVCAVLHYLKKGTLVADLVKKGLFFPDESGKIPEKVKEKDKPPAYRAVAGDVSGALVRFKVEDYEDLESIQEFWKDPDIQQKYIQWYLSTQTEVDLCYATGRRIPSADNNPSKIRHKGDKAKLISGNDKSNFTFRGRFKTAAQAARIGYETTQKAHNALKWLIDKQGYRNGDAVCLSWGTRGEELPTLGPSGSDCLGGERLAAVLREDFAKNLRYSLRGWYQDLSDHAGVSIICLDSATEGRMSITYYREMSGTEYLDRIAFWYGTCVWPMWFKKDWKDPKSESIEVLSAPSLNDIFVAAFGENAGDKFKKSVFQRLLPCIADGARIPPDIVKNLLIRASKPFAVPERQLRVACAVIRKYLNDKYNPGVYTVDAYKEVFTVNLNEKQDERSYLFGRMWAYYHYMEQLVLWRMKDKRDTNALRLRSRFRTHPASTAGILDDKLLPYLRRGNLVNSDLMAELGAIAIRLKGQGEGGTRGDFTDEPLNECFVLGYMSQLDELNKRYRKKNNGHSPDTEDEPISNEYEENNE
ncbi:MAG: type I-C CRISPR-associated protein Cas8c/Csd1 [Christensenellales bacterium]|jgi:CRISPR-associated protein Csd1